MKVIVFNHIYKNAGTTIWERYKNNPCSTLLRYPTWNWPDECIRIKDGTPYTVPFKPKKLEPPPYYIHGRCHPGMLESYTPGTFTIDPTYVTTLREPIERIMSAYNFYITDVYHKWGINMDVNYRLWFLNAYTILPTRYESQMEWFCLHVFPDPTIGWREENKTTYERFRNRSFGKKRLPGETGMTDIEAKEIEELNCEKAFDNIIEHYKHVFFLEDERFLTKLDNIFKERDIPVIPNKKISYIHKTSDSYGPMDREYIQFSDLSNEDQEFTQYMLEYEIKFYNKCKSRWL